MAQIGASLLLRLDVLYSLHDGSRPLPASPVGDACVVFSSYRTLLPEAGGSTQEHLTLDRHCVCLLTLLHLLILKTCWEVTLDF